MIIGDSPTVTIKIYTKSSPTPITVTLHALDTRIFQVEDFQRLDLTNTTDRTGNLGLYIEKTFCICCNNQNNSCNKYYS